MSFAVCSLKAQTLQQKFQKDNEERRKHANAIHLKANEQQLQQRAEKINAPVISQNTGAGNPVQTDKPIIPQEKKEQTKPSEPVKKTEPIQQAILRKKEN